VSADMYIWKDVTEFFSESQRYYKDCYLEIDEVYDECVEVSLFSSQKGLYEIYVSYGHMYGIIYAEAEEAEAKREEVKAVLEKEFAEKYKLCIPNDIFFDDSGVFDF